MSTTEQLKHIIDSFDDEYSYMMGTEAENPDMWTDVDVPVKLLRQSVSRIETLEAENERLKGDRDHLDRTLRMVIEDTLIKQEGMKPEQAKIHADHKVDLSLSTFRSMFRSFLKDTKEGS